MNIPDDGEELMEISVLSEEGLIETSVPTEDLLGVNDPSEEVVTETSDHEEDLFVPLLQGKKLMDLQARLNASKQLNKAFV